MAPTATCSSSTDMKALRTLLFALLTTALSAGADFAHAQELHVRDAGSWHEAQEVHVRVSGTWQEVDEGWVRVSGVWQQFYAADAPYLAGGTYGCIAYNTTASVTVEFRTDGSLYIDRAAACVTSDQTITDQWHEGHPITSVGTGYYVDRTVNSGSLDLSDSGSCVEITTTRAYGIQRTSAGTDTAQVDFEIHDAAGCAGTPVATATINFSAFYDTI